MSEINWHVGTDQLCNIQLWGYSSIRTFVASDWSTLISALHTKHHTTKTINLSFCILIKNLRNVTFPTSLQILCSPSYIIMTQNSQKTWSSWERTQWKTKWRPPSGPTRSSLLQPGQRAFRIEHMWKLASTNPKEHFWTLVERWGCSATKRGSYYCDPTEEL